MIVSSQLFEAYLECSTKCWLRSRAEPAAGNVYAEWARAQNETYCQDGLKRLLAILPESDRATAPPIPKNSKDATWRLAIDVRWRTSDLESRLHAVERIPSEGRGRPAQFIPYRFEFANKLTKKAQAAARVRCAPAVRSARTRGNSRQDRAWRQPRHAEGEDTRLRQ